MTDQAKSDVAEARLAMALVAELLKRPEFIRRDEGRPKIETVDSRRGTEPAVTAIARLLLGAVRERVAASKQADSETEVRLFVTTIMGLLHQEGFIEDDGDGSPTLVLNDEHPHCEPLIVSLAAEIVAAVNRR